MVKPILDMDAVGAAHPKWVRSWFNESTNYAYQKIKMVAYPQQIVNVDFIQNSYCLIAKFSLT
jgi:hypothetical protein